MANGDVDDLLEKAKAGDEAAEQALFALLYEELHGIAGRVFRSQRGHHTLQATALVHEAFLKMARPGAAAGWNDRTHFMAVAARAMRQILVNHARDRAALKRGGPDARRVTLSGLGGDAPGGSLEVLTLHELIEELGTLHERQARVAELRLFGGLEIAEIAAEIGVSKRTIEMDWRMAKDWLAARLGDT